jgi:hypothetical protein
VPTVWPAFVILLQIAHVEIRELGRTIGAKKQLGVGDGTILGNDLSVDL